MSLLKRENWWIWLLLYLFAGGAGIIVLAALLDVYDKNAWYANWRYWAIGALCFLFPVAIMMSVFIIQITCQAAARLKVPGKEIYLSPYVWILCLIVPIFGWILLFVMILYLQIWTLVMLSRGAGEEYLS